VSVSKFVFCWVGSKCVETKTKNRVGRASRSTVAEACMTLASLPLCGVASSIIRRENQGQMLGVCIRGLPRRGDALELSRSSDRRCRGTALLQRLGSLKMSRTRMARDDLLPSS
jgi:hypothetical protein